MTFEVSGMGMGVGITERWLYSKNLPSWPHERREKTQLEVGKIEPLKLSVLHGGRAGGHRHAPTIFFMSQLGEE